MMKMKRTLSLVLTLSMLLALCVCGTASAAGTETAVDPAGGYILTGITGGEGSDLEIISRVVDLGARFFLFLNDDGSGFMRFMDAEIPLSWDGNGIVIAPQGKLTKDVVLPCVYDADSVSIRTLVYTMDFRALTDAELADYRANGPGSLGGMLGAIVQGLLGKLGDTLGDSLLFSLALGALQPDVQESIPDGAVTKGTVSGTVNGMDYTILGAEHVEDAEAGDLIVFYYDATNRNDEIGALWYETFEASQDGEFLEEVFSSDAVPEAFNTNFDFVPGRTLRAASMFAYDPEGGKVSFRISSDYDEENTLCYYADPQALSGAPETPFAFDADPSIPEIFADLPEGTENIIFEDVEFFTNGDGENAMRYFIRYPNDSEEGEDYLFHYSDVFQDGIQLSPIWDDPDTVSNPEEHIKARAVILRTESPVVIVVTEDGDTGEAPAAAKVIEPQSAADALNNAA